MAQTWSDCLAKLKVEPLNIVKYQAIAGSLCTLLEKLSGLDMEASSPDAAGGDVTQQECIWCSCTCRRLGACTAAKAGHHPDHCTTAPIAAMISMAVIIH
jgi:hypothetical protein